MIVKAYHTLEDLDNVDEIESDGPQKCTRVNSWLGDGYYFWDTNIGWAHDWGKNYASYMIFEAQIQINEQTFDLLGSVEHKLILEKARDLILDKNLISRSSITVKGILRYLQRQGIFTYNSIRIGDWPKEFSIPYQMKRNEVYFGGDRVQICLLTKTNLISHSFKCIYPEKYL